MLAAESILVNPRHTKFSRWGPGGPTPCNPSRTGRQVTNLTESLAHLPATLQQFEERTGLSDHGARMRMRKLVKAGLAEQWGQTLSDKGALVDVYAKKERM